MTLYGLARPFLFSLDPEEAHRLALRLAGLVIPKRFDSPVRAMGLDPTNNCVASETHVRLAVGKSFTDCSPVKGTYRGGTSAHTMEVFVSVAYEDGSTTDPENTIASIPSATKPVQNSFRKHLEMLHNRRHADAERPGEVAD